MIQSLERKCIVSIEEVESLLKENVLNNLNEWKRSRETEVAGEKIYTYSDRYKTFFSKGYKCCVCGIEGKYFALERSAGSKRYHLNLYAVNNNGEEVLMTKDHIIPKSRGGKNNLDNYQPMCTICNGIKGNGTIQNIPKKISVNPSHRAKAKEKYVNPKKHSAVCYLIEIDGKFVRYDNGEKKIHFEKFPFCATHFKNATVKEKAKEFLESGIFTQEQFEKCNFLTRGEANQLFTNKYHIGIDLALKEFKAKN